MDATDVFRLGLGSVIHRPSRNYVLPPTRSPNPNGRGEDHSGESDGSSHRIAHTLTACCRCRQRKTRCDPTLPRCLPCERSGSTCEYFDTAKGRRISRYYVIKLQDKVRQLEAELSQYTDEDEFPRNTEDMVRPGGLVRLNETDETPRYLGPSSGIAMTRLLMEEAKRYTESKKISDLIPEVRARRLARMQSITMTGGVPGGSVSMRKKSFPMVSAVPAQGLPSRQITEKLVDVFKERAQVFWPTLHETTFAQDLEDVYQGNKEPYKNFVVNMVMAISLQKLDAQWAGLADSYYLAAMQFFESVVRPKDLRTLQCLALIGQYSLLTPTRTAVYYIVGLATRICQQLGLADEKTIERGYSMGADPLTLDMRRRLSWIVTLMEFGLAHSMGRPNGFAKSDDLVDVGFFEPVDDQYITEEGIVPGAPRSQKKLVAIHFCRMRLVQAEIRRVLYEKKRSEPRDEKHPRFIQMEQNAKDWLSASPADPPWCKPWFTGRYHTMVIMLNRPSPQIPKPTPLAASKCFDSAAYIINLSSQQMKKGAVDITWVFILGLYMAVNTLLWTVSYEEIREAHPKEEMEELVNNSLDIIDHATERWPGTAAASQLYAVFAKACLQSYDARSPPPLFPHVYPTQTGGAFDSPPSMTDGSPPPNNRDHSMSGVSNPHHQFPLNPVQFGYVFGPPVEEPVAKPGPPPGSTGGVSFAQPAYAMPDRPQFRAGSIFFSPSSSGVGDRRPSYFPPDYPMAPPLPPASVAHHHQPSHLSQSQTDSPENNSSNDSPYMDEMTPPATHTPGRAYDSSASPPDTQNLPGTHQQQQRHQHQQQRQHPHPPPLPTPPESSFAGSSGGGAPPSVSSGLSPASSQGGVMSALATPTPSLSHVSPSATAATTPVAVPQVMPTVPTGKIEPLPPPRHQPPAFTIPQMQGQQQQHHHMQQQQQQQHQQRQNMQHLQNQQRQRQPSLAQQQQQQRPLPAGATTVTDWFNPAAPFLSNAAFGGGSSDGPGAPPSSANGGGWPPSNSNTNNGIRAPPTQYIFPTSNPATPGPPPPPPHGPFAGGGRQNGGGGDIDGMLTGGFGGFGGSIGGSGTGSIMMTGAGFERHGSLSAEQQLEMMDVLEAEGMGDIDNFLAGLGAFGQPQSQQHQVGVGAGGMQPWGR